MGQRRIDARGATYNWTLRKVGALQKSLADRNVRFDETTAREAKIAALKIAEEQKALLKAKADTPETRGMIHKVRHLVEVAE